MMRFFLATAMLGAIAAGATAAPQQRDAGEKAADPGDKVICKKFLETGSLVRGYRVCKTKVEWQRDRDLLRQTNGSQGCKSASIGDSCG